MALERVSHICAVKVHKDVSRQNRASFRYAIEISQKFRSHVLPANVISKLAMVKWKGSCTCCVYCLCGCSINAATQVT